MALIDKYTKDELQDIVKRSFCLNDVMREIGYKTNSGSNHITVKKRLKYYNISTSHFTYQPPHKICNEEVFCKNSSVSQCTVRRWYSKISNHGECAICGQKEIWNGKPMIMVLDHINGDNHDNRMDNLRWICPNCNSQLPTFAGRNIKAVQTRNKARK